MQKLLIIVVPVFKVEQYIIVNDGALDRSAEISRVYTVRYPQTFRM